MRKQVYGFGVDPLLAKNHFYVLIKDKVAGSISPPKVEIYERYSWTDGEEQELTPIDILRLEISKHKWDEVKHALTTEFNARLKKDKIKMGKFSPKGGTPVEKLFGKEMMVLLWGIEHADPSIISTAIRNWKGLLPEERWWLYTMTNAATGNMGDKKGWRTALRYALCENPVIEKSQISIFDDIDQG